MQYCGQTLHINWVQNLLRTLQFPAIKQERTFTYFLLIEYEYNSEHDVNSDI